MANEAPDPVLLDQLIGNISGLATQIGELKESVRNETRVREQENRKRDERIRWSRRAIALALVVGVFAVVVAVGSIVAFQRQHDSDARAQAERRTAFCHSLDDIGAAAEAAANGAAEGTLKTFFDPAFQSPDRPPTPQAVIDLFVQKLRDNTRSEVHGAVAAQIAAVKAKNGFSSDCTKINQPGG